MKTLYSNDRIVTAESIQLKIEELQRDIDELNRLWQLLLEQYEKGYREGFLRSITAIIYNITQDLNTLNCGFSEMQSDYFHLREYVTNNTLCLSYRKAHREKLLNECKEIAIQRYLEELRANNGKFDGGEKC